jgi:hypothetical protein
MLLFIDCSDGLFPLDFRATDDQVLQAITQNTNTKLIFCPPVHTP